MNAGSRGSEQLQMYRIISQAGRDKHVGSPLLTHEQTPICPQHDYHSKWHSNYKER